MKIINRGVLNAGNPGSARAVSTFPSVTPLQDGSLLATYRVGSTKDSDDETVELRRSDDGGRSWSEPVSPFKTSVNGKQGSLKLVYVTVLTDGSLIAAAMWVDREAFPGMPLFSEETEGCLPMAILLANSNDQGKSWTAWRALPMPEEIGPPSLTNPILQLTDGRLIVSIESNKAYLDNTPWLQRVVYIVSNDAGLTWNAPIPICSDPAGRIFHWDQRAAVCPQGEITTFTWTYDKVAKRYLNIQQRFSADGGASWSESTDSGVTDQPSHPAVLPDGRICLAWVDRFHTRSIRARIADDFQSPFAPETEVVLYEYDMTLGDTVDCDASTGELLANMGVWDFGLPFAEATPDGNVIVVYYSGTLSSSLQAHWVLLSV